MRGALRILAISGHLVALQLVAGVVAWWLSPWPWIASLVAIVWLVVLVIDLRHPRFAGALSGWQRMSALLLVEAPAVIFGVWNVLYFLGAAPRFELGAFVVQLWLTPMMPLLALCPNGVVLERDLWLWALSIAPMMLIIGAMIASAVRRPAVGEPS